MASSGRGESSVMHPPACIVSSSRKRPETNLESEALTSTTSPMTPLLTRATKWLKAGQKAVLLASSSTSPFASASA